MALAGDVAREDGRRRRSGDTIERDVKCRGDRSSSWPGLQPGLYPVPRVLPQPPLVTTTLQERDEDDAIAVERLAKEAFNHATDARRLDDLKSMTSRSWWKAARPLRRGECA